MSEPHPLPKTAPRGTLIVAFAIVYIVWGSTYLAIKLGLESFPPFLMAGIRFLIAGTLLAGWCAIRREPSATGREYSAAAGVGLLLVTCGNGFVTLAEKTIPSGLAALIVAIGPAVTMLIQWVTGRRGRPGVWAISGLLLGLGGVGLLVAGNAMGKVDPTGVGLILAATVAWSCGVLRSQTIALPPSVMRSNVAQMLAGGSALLIIGTVRGEWPILLHAHLSTTSILAVAYLVVFGALLAYTVYAWLIQRVSATLAGTTAYVNPAVAVLLGSLWGEPIGPNVFVAMAAIFAGVWFLRRDAIST